MMKSDEYIKVLQLTLITHMQKAFTDGEGTFQQGVNTLFIVQKMKKFLSDNNTAVLKWPGNSPIIQKELQKYDCTTTTPR